MLLTEKRPLKTPFVFGGRSFIIDTAFNNVLSVLEVLDDAELTKVDRAMMALYFLTGEEEFSDPRNVKSRDYANWIEELLKTIFDEVVVEESVQKAVPTDILGNPLPIKEAEDEESSFDFKHDGGYIYSSFMQAYRIDLYEQHDKMNWETFLALFNGLPGETIMAKVIDIRKREMPTGKGSQKEAEELREAKRHFALPERNID